MHFLFLYTLRRTHHHHHHHHQQWRTIFEDTLAINYVRDRGLDHAVEREKNLKPLINIKNLIKSEPSKSIPLNIITQSKDSLQIPTRPIEFIRNYPSVFQEFFPAGVKIHPHVKLTPEVLNLDADEDLFYQSVSYKEDVADRLLKLLMIGKINKIPLFVLDKLKWDLGLCQDYSKTIVPDYPDYFRVTNGSNLELVCWSHELAVSFLQKQAMKSERGDLDEEGMVNFALSYSNGFEMDKKYKKWVDEWQKLPYVSPYENAMHFPPKSDESDKWAMAILHEILNLCVGKKAERDNLLLLGECLGLRSRFKRALSVHPGIIYESHKIGTYTVVLREGYKRGMLIQRNPLVDLRSRYAHLMNTVTVDNKSKDKKQKTSKALKEGDVEKQDDDKLEDEDEEDDDSEEDSDDVYDDYEDDDSDKEARDVKASRRVNLRDGFEDTNPPENLRSSARRNPNRAVERTSGRSSRRPESDSRRSTSRTRFDDRKPPATLRTSDGRNHNRVVERSSGRSPRRPESNGDEDSPTRFVDRRPPANFRSFAGRNHSRVAERSSGRRPESSSDQDAPRRFGNRKPPATSFRTSAGRASNRAEERTSTGYSRRPEANNDSYSHNSRNQGKYNQRTSMQ